MMAELLRTEDVLARFGGEEFTILCRGSDQNGAKIVAERLRRAVEERKFTFGGKDIPVTISLGHRRRPRERRQRSLGFPGGRRQGALRGQAQRAQPRLPARLGEDAQARRAAQGPRPQRADRRRSGGRGASRRRRQRSRATARIAASASPTAPDQVGRAGIDAPRRARRPRSARARATAPRPTAGSRASPLASSRWRAARRTPAASGEQRPLPSAIRPAATSSASLA